ncbi:MAG: sigma-70 family RNA polymerase sigma factor [Saprospiraceae bacterium]|nr:sigma-70 family RNA polymerase sigma factor [Lewinella sp.]
MSKRYQEDEQLLLRIREGDRSFLNQLFQDYWPSFLAFLTKSFGMPEEDVREIYTRSFTTFFYNIKDGKLVPPLQSRLKTYLFGIGKNYAMKKFGSAYEERMVHTDEMEDVQKAFQQPDVVDYYEYDWQRNLVEKLLNRIGEPCKELLLLSFVREFADDAIMDRLDIPSAVAVRQRRFRCLEKLRSMVKEEDY